MLRFAASAALFVSLVGGAEHGEVLNDMCEACFGPTTKNSPIHALARALPSGSSKNALQPIRRLLADNETEADETEADEPETAGDVAIKKSLKVGVSIRPPYVMWEDPMSPDLGVCGFSADLWRSVTLSDQPKGQMEAQGTLKSINNSVETGPWSHMAGLDAKGRVQLYEIKSDFLVDLVGNNKEKLVKGEIDVIITGTAVSKTLRDKGVQFSIPFWFAGTSITHPTNTSDGGVPWFLIVERLLGVVATMLASLSVVALFYWWFEQRSKEEQDLSDHGDSDFDCVPSRSFFSGYGLSLWWAAVTMTSVGYGDVFPRSKMGKLIGFIWMFVSLFLLGNFLGNIVAALQQDQLNSGQSIIGLASLQGQKVGVLQGSAISNNLASTQLGIEQVEFFSVQAAMQATLRGEVAAVVSRQEVAQYMTANSPNLKLVPVSNNHYSSIAYAFSPQTDAKLIEFVNARIIAAQFSNGVDFLVEQYFNGR